MKHRGVICDKCGVEVTQAKVRRERLGHIALATPVSHVWFFKGLPSRIGHLLDISLRDLERVLYFEAYVVVDPGETELKQNQLLNEEQYRKAREEHQHRFRAQMGAEAIKELLKRVNIERLAVELREKMRGEQSAQKKLKYAKRLKVVDSFRKSSNRPEWMILDVIPVIPPELRPLVPLDGGRFATSDLNDLYRRVINRNNRLKKLMELKAPDVIIRNEKRMLQEAVDALFDNGRRGRVLRGANNRPLKSLSDTLKGKQGRFRQNLLGKRVDYSGRSVIVVGPELKLHQCGLPKKMALELFKPFIYNKLEERGLVADHQAGEGDGGAAASRGVGRARGSDSRASGAPQPRADAAPPGHPGVRAGAGRGQGDPHPPARLHGVQRGLRRRPDGRPHPAVARSADRGVGADAVEQQHPLAGARRADRDSVAGHRARVLLLDEGQDRRQGRRTRVRQPGRRDARARGGRARDVVADPPALYRRSAGSDRVARRSGRAADGSADGQEQDHQHDRRPRDPQPVDPDEMPFVNGLLKKKGLQQLVQSCYLKFGLEKTVEMLDSLKNLGFTYATRSGLSIGIDDLVIPERKASLVSSAEAEVIKVESQYLEGAITNGERYNKVIAIWSEATEDIANAMFNEMEQIDKEGRQFNPVYIMADSGARGSKQQIRQLAGMRGLMAKPSGEIIETPIKSNFREGLTVLQYFISTHGARKGLADTALKTADSGYLTRRLVDVAQDVIIHEVDCGTVDGIEARAIVESGEVIEPLRDRIIGRTTLEKITDPFNGEVIIDVNGMMDEELSSRIQDAGIEKVKIRSVLTCTSRRGVCAKCYGRDLATGRMVELGQAVGVIAAQSIGEPGTQLTMRTFHIGGTASRVSEQSTLEARNAGTVRFQGMQVVEAKDGGLVVMNRNGSLVVQDQKGRDRERYPIVYGARLKVKEGQQIEQGQVLVEWDPYTFSILTEEPGQVKFKDILEGITVHEEVDEVTGLSRYIIVDSPDEKKQPAIEIKSAKDGKIGRKYHMPVHAHLMIQDGEMVSAGDVLAKIPRETTKTKDITGGLPRVVELFEARKPRETAVISEIDGVVKHGGIVKGQRKIIIVPDEPGAEPREYALPRGVHVNVQEGERVRAGEPLMDGPSNPHDILNVLGEKALQSYLVNEIQEVYRLQGVNINDKHIETIARQMMRWVKIEDVGDTEFLVDEQVDKFRFLEENERVIQDGGRPAQGRPLLLGITKASLSTDSFISAASFQETTRVLTEASISGKVDHLRGLKENVTMGRLIPAGTGFEYYRNVRIPADEPPPPPAPPQPSDDEMELERDMEYFVEPEEALGPRTGDLGE